MVKGSGFVEGRQEGSGSGMTGHPGTIRTGVLARQVAMEIAWKHGIGMEENGMIEDALILRMICISFVENTLNFHHLQQSNLLQLNHLHQQRVNRPLLHPS